MEPHDRIQTRESGPIAELLAFSSCSWSVDDIWAHDLPRPYQIVLLPGYTVPEALDRGDRDAVWHPGDSVERPVIAWDGFCPVALHEVILECFDYEGSSPFIKVVDGRSGKVVKDPRDPEILKYRPRRAAGWGERQISNHHVELYFWSGMLPTSDPTSRMYGDLISPSFRSLRNTLDSYERYQAFHARGIRNHDVDELHDELVEDHKAGRIRINRTVCARGINAVPAGGGDVAREVRDKEVALFDTSMSAMNDMAGLTLSDMPADGTRPASFYRLARLKGERLLAEERAEIRALETGGRPSDGASRPLSGGARPHQDDNPF